MQRDQKDKMSKEEIIKYVDDLIKANKRYDKRLAPLLYDFFLRANEKFGVRIDIWTHFMRECIINYVH